jgi:hypothetical protein
MNKGCEKKMFILIPPLWPAIPLLLIAAGTLIITEPAFPLTYVSFGFGAIQAGVAAAALVAVAF